jgi:uncharacterized protein
MDPASLPDQAQDDDETHLIIDAGHRHEQDYLDQLRARTTVAEISADCPLEQRVLQTIDAMQGGAPIIYQAAFLSGPWHGLADFLRRVDQPSALNGWSYEPIDTKLAREPRAKHLVQLSLYGDLIETVQGRQPEKLHVVLGSGEEHSFAARDFRYTIAVSKDRYLDFIDRGANGTSPEPCGACKLCGWRELCTDEWERTDHLSRVAGLTRPQVKKLRDAGIITLTALAEAPSGTFVPKLAANTFEKVRAQANARRQALQANENAVTFGTVAR